jgi:hypothetical protein
MYRFADFAAAQRSRPPVDETGAQRTIDEALDIYRAIEDIFFGELERAGNTIDGLSWVRTNCFLVSTVISHFLRLVYGMIGARQL